MKLNEPKSERFPVFHLLLSQRDMARFLEPSMDCDEFILHHVKSSRLVPAKKDYWARKLALPMHIWESF